VTRVLKQWEIRANEEDTRRREEYERKITRYTIHGNPVILSDAQIGLLNSRCSKITQQQVIDTAYKIQQSNLRVLERQKQAKLEATISNPTVDTIAWSNPESIGSIVEDRDRRKTKVLDAEKQRGLMTGNSEEVMSYIVTPITSERAKSADTSDLRTSQMRETIVAPEKATVER
jgi:hypothetical protein